MKVYLIGMPGSGKSTLGKQLATALLLPFVDLDHEIEKQEQQSIPIIFSEKGEDYFRQVESQKLREWAGSATSFVMATGGGAPCFFNGLEIINTSGISIFLDVPVSELLKRVQQDKNRPLLNAGDLKAKEQRLTSLYVNRFSIYNLATYTITNPSLEKVLDTLRIKR